MLAGCSEYVETVSEPVDYVSTLTGTLSHHAFSTGNTYPAVALPWGMNFWTPQGGRMGDGWAYRYDQNWIRGFKQTHQPSPWINDYGQFSIMPVSKPVFDQHQRASWFSHKAEQATPYYYSVYLADHDASTEMTPTERAAMFRITYPEAEMSYFVVDAFDRGSYIKILPDGKTIVGYSTRNSGGLAPNFKNWFVVESDTPFEYVSGVADGQFTEGKASPHFGRSHVHWLTGTASTVMVGCVEGIMGMRPDMNGLKIAPSIPSDWDGFEIEKDFRGSHLHIVVKNPDHVESGCKELTVDGKKMEGNYIPASVLGKTSEVVLVMGK